MYTLTRRTYPVKTFVDEIFDNFLEYGIIPREQKWNQDITENEKNFIVEMVLAGIMKEDISINIEDDVLSIIANRKDEVSNYYKKQLFTGKIEKSFTLPENIDIDKIETTFIDGILKIIIPKKNIEKNNRKKIEIR